MFCSTANREDVYTASSYVYCEMFAYNVVVVLDAYEWYNNAACDDLGSVLAAVECDTDDDCLWICHPFVSIHILDFARHINCTRVDQRLLLLLLLLAYFAKVCLGHHKRNSVHVEFNKQVVCRK